MDKIQEVSLESVKEKIDEELEDIQIEEDLKESFIDTVAMDILPEIFRIEVDKSEVFGVDYQTNFKKIAEISYTLAIEMYNAKIKLNNEF